MRSILFAVVVSTFPTIGISEVAPPVRKVCIPPSDGSYVLDLKSTGFSPTTGKDPVSGDPLIGSRTIVRCAFDRQNNVVLKNNQTVGFVAKCPAGYFVQMPGFSLLESGGKDTPRIAALVTKVLAGGGEESAFTFAPPAGTQMAKGLTVSVLCTQ